MGASHIARGYILICNRNNSASCWGYRNHGAIKTTNVTRLTTPQTAGNVCPHSWTEAAVFASHDSRSAQQAVAPALGAGICQSETSAIVAGRPRLRYSVSLAQDKSQLSPLYQVAPIMIVKKPVYCIQNAPEQLIRPAGKRAP